MLEEILKLILPNILEIIITIISILIARYVVPCIKNDIVPWLKEKRLNNIIKSFVQAVEKMAESGVITKESKKQKVIELLEAKGIVVDETISMFIESAVKELDIITSTFYDEIIVDPNAEIKTEFEVKEDGIVEPEVIIETEDI